MKQNKNARGKYSKNDYFRMGAAVAVGEMNWMSSLGEFVDDDAQIRTYLESFGIRGMDDIDELGIGHPYRRDFERLFGADEE